jgi:hypothetical protein
VLHGHQWAHLRRDFHDIWKSTDSAIARDALEQIGKLYDVERAITAQRHRQQCGRASDQADQQCR